MQFWLLPVDFGTWGCVFPTTPWSTKAFRLFSCSYEVFLPSFVRQNNSLMRILLGYFFVIRLFNTRNLGEKPFGPHSPPGQRLSNLVLAFCQGFKRFAGYTWANILTSIHFGFFFWVVEMTLSTFSYLKSRWDEANGALGSWVQELAWSWEGKVKYLLGWW